VAFDSAARDLQRRRFGLMTLMLLLLRETHGRGLAALETTEAGD
jgi:hypothetical protein